MHKRLVASTALAIVISLAGVVHVVPAGASATTGLGYWEAQTDGGVYALGDAPDHGGASHLTAPIVGIAALPGGQGYVLIGSDGGVFTFGRAKFYGSTGAMPLTRPVVGIAYTPTGRGYYLVAADGGIFTFGDAKFRGSTGALRLRSPIVGMSVTATGKGYWLVAADGGIFTFGDAAFRGSAASIALGGPIVGMAATHDGRGYWLASGDGSVYGFGSAAHFGSTVGQAVRPPIAAITASSTGKGYLLMSKFGDVAAFGDASRCFRGVNDRNPQSGSPKVNNVGIAIPFAPAAVGSPPAGSCGGPSREFHLSAPFRIDVGQSVAPPSFRRGSICAISLARVLPGGRLSWEQHNESQTPGRMEVRAAQMRGSTTFRIQTSQNCLAIARPGAGGKQSLPFWRDQGGDSFPFTSDLPLKIDSSSYLITKIICRLQVFRNSDGRVVYDHQGTESHTVIPPGTYFVRTEGYGCPVRVERTKLLEPENNS